MTEAEWLACPTVGQMIAHAEAVGSERKLRLFAYAMCSRIDYLLVDQRLLDALATLERYSEGRCGLSELGHCYSQAKEAVNAIEAPLYGDDGILEGNAESMAACAVLCAVKPNTSPTRNESFSTSPVSSVAFYSRAAPASVVFSRTVRHTDAEAVEKAESLVQVRLLHDIFGNPFGSVRVDTRWLSANVVSLAHAIYEDRDFNGLPILADALEDAKCDNTEILDHCRSNGPHVRGCWALDLTLGKE